MGNVACILRTIEGFVVMTNSNRLPGRELICLNDNKVALVFHDDVIEGLKAFDEVKGNITPQNSIREIFDLLSSHLVKNYSNKIIGIIGCGFEGNEAFILGVSTAFNYTVRRFQNVVTADGDPSFNFYKEMIYKNTGTAEDALLFSSIWVTKLAELNPLLAMDFSFATVTKYTIQHLDQDETFQLLKRAIKFHRNVVTSSVDMFLEA